MRHSLRNLDRVQVLKLYKNNKLVQSMGAQYVLFFNYQ